MIKQLKSLMFAGIFCSTAFAGSMGAIDNNPAFSSFFVAGEGAYTWIHFDNSKYNGRASSLTSNRWGGRFAGGFAHSLSSYHNISFTGETGLGYFGSCYIKSQDQVLKFRSKVEGLDLLLGGAYSLNQFDVYLKGGAMVQSLLYNTHINQSGVSRTTGRAYTISGNRSNTSTQVLPELKVGGLYHYNTDLALTLAYMHAFGSTNSFSTVVNSTSSLFSFYKSSNFQNPTLDSVLLGLQYNFF